MLGVEKKFLVSFQFVIVLSTPCIINDSMQFKNFFFAMEGPCLSVSSKIRGSGREFLLRQSVSIGVEKKSAERQARGKRGQHANRYRFRKDPLAYLREVTRIWGVDSRTKGYTGASSFVSISIEGTRSKPFAFSTTFASQPLTPRLRLSVSQNSIATSFADTTLITKYTRGINGTCDRLA